MVLAQTSSTRYSEAIHAVNPFYSVAPEAVFRILLWELEEMQATWCSIILTKVFEQPNVPHSLPTDIDTRLIDDAILQLPFYPKYNS